SLARSSSRDRQQNSVRATVSYKTRNLHQSRTNARARRACARRARTVRYLNQYRESSAPRGCRIRVAAEATSPLQSADPGPECEQSPASCRQIGNDDPELVYSTFPDDPFNVRGGSKRVVFAH